MVIYKQADTRKELYQILSLQQINLPKNLTEIEKKREGFLTIEHDIVLLEQMNNACQHTLAKDGENVVGYALSMHPRFSMDIELLRPMFSEIKKAIKDIDGCMVMGQVCIAKAYRGQGIFKMLYQKMKEFIAPEFTKIITEVDVKNVRSMNAHAAIGFTELKRYTAGEKEWSLIIWQ